MALPPIDYVLEVAADGNKRTNDPAGTYQPTRTTPTPTGFRVTGTNYTTIDFAWNLDDPFDADVFEFQYALASSSSWFPAPVPFVTISARAITQTPLTQNTAYKFQIRTVHTPSGQASSWSPVITGTTLALPTAGDTDLQALYYYENFQAGSEGQPISSFTTFELSNSSIATSVTAFPGGGTRCAETWCPEGIDGVGSWGGLQKDSFPTLATTGEVWIRGAMVFATGYPFDSSIGSIPIYTVSLSATPDDSYDSFVVLSADSVTQQILLRTSLDGSATAHYFDAVITPGAWQLIELYVLSSADPAAGKVRLWVDGAPVTTSGGADDYTLQTAGAADQFINGVWWHGSWASPGGRGPIYKSYLDEFAIAANGALFGGGTVDNRDDMDLDSNTFNYIGGAITYVEPEEPDTGPGPGLGVTDLDNIWFYENFENLNPGDNVSDNTNLGTGPRATVVDTPVYPGTTRAASTYIACADFEYNPPSDSWGGGYNKWGFGYTSGYPKMVNDGSEYWFRVAVFYPTTHSWYTGSGGGRIKNIRANKVSGINPPSGSDGYIDSYFEQDGELVQTIEGRDDTDGNPSWEYSGVYMPKGRWVMLEEYAQLGAGRDGRRKMWLDGVLIQSLDNLGMHDEADFTVWRMLWHTYWNGWPAFCGLPEGDTSNPAIQMHYFGHVAMAVRGNVIGVGAVDDVPFMDRDENGFPFIGLAAR